MRKQMLFCLVLMIALSSTAPAASTLHIGFGVGTLCATGCGGHPNTTDSSPGGGSNGGGLHLSASFNVYNNSGSPTTYAQQPVLLILGVAAYQDPVTDPGRFTKNSITAVTTYNPYDPANLSNAVSHPSSAWTYGSTAFGVHGTQPAGNGYQGFFTSGDAYGFLNLQGGGGVNNSQSIGNWNLGIQQAYGANSQTPAGYEMYVFGLNVPLVGKGLIDVQVATDPVTGNSVVPAKTYVIAYALDKAGKPLVVPMTEGALQTPEPSAVLLMSSVAGALLYFIRRRQVAKSVGA